MKITLNVMHNYTAHSPPDNLFKGKLVFSSLELVVGIAPNLK